MLGEFLTFRAEDEATTRSRLFFLLQINLSIFHTQTARNSSQFSSRPNKLSPISRALSLGALFVSFARVRVQFQRMIDAQTFPERRAKPPIIIATRNRKQSQIDSLAGGGGQPKAPHLISNI